MNDRQSVSSSSESYDLGPSPLTLKQQRFYVTAIELALLVGLILFGGIHAGYLCKAGDGSWHGTTLPAKRVGAISTYRAIDVEITSILRFTSKMPLRLIGNTVVQVSLWHVNIVNQGNVKVLGNVASSVISAGGVIEVYDVMNSTFPAKTVVVHGRVINAKSLK